MLQVRVNAERQRPRDILDPTKLGFGESFTPNFFITEFDNGWQNPRIEPLRSLEMHPGSLVLHYAQTIFEGLKAYRRADDSIVLFRPELNASRFNRSASRMGMPEVDTSLFVEALRQLVDCERYFVPAAPGSLYLRPTMIAKDACIGIRSSKTYLFYILALPTGAYFKESGLGTGSIEVFVSESVVRAFPGGTGDVKTGANYAVTLDVTSRARSQGCSQVLFLDAANRSTIEEMGGMNVFFVSGGRLLTPPLSGTILSGVVRQSILEMASDLGLDASECPLNLNDIVQGIRDRSVTEAFACGTAACVASIGHLKFEDGRRVAIGAGDVGPVTNTVFNALQSLYYGQLPDSYGWTTPVFQAETVTA